MSLLTLSTCLLGCLVVLSSGCGTLTMKSHRQTAIHTASLLREGFSCLDTKASHHGMYLHNEQQLQGELQRLEVKLSNYFTILKHSLLHDRLMSTCGFKIWVNGASYHIQMLIHQARLDRLANLCHTGFIQSMLPLTCICGTWTVCWVNTRVTRCVLLQPEGLFRRTSLPVTYCRQVCTW